MGILDTFKQKKTLAELEEEKEYNEAELSITRQRVLKKELESRGQELDNFKDESGKPVWSRVTNWLKTH